MAGPTAISQHARDLLRASDVIDLHVDTFIPMRLFGWDPGRRHDSTVLRGVFFGHLDLPRLRESGLTGAMWSITTNPLRTPTGRWRALERNLERLRRFVEEGEGLALARTYGEYLRARVEGRHAVMPAVQGGHALDAAPAIPKDLVRVTLVHLTSSRVGVTSSPLRLRGGGLGGPGFELIRRLDAARVFVDLAHIDPKGFWEAVKVHDPARPLIVTHTGVTGVRPHWRNLDDGQLRAVADSGGTVGILFHGGFLARRGGPRDGAMVIEHMEHVIEVAGDDFVSIGSDYDGLIVPPSDLRAGAAYPRLVQHMLDRGWSDDRVRKVLGGNFLRAFAHLRP